MTQQATIKRYFELIKYKTYAELKAEASSYFLGILWWVLEPGLYLLAFYSVFRWGIRQGDQEFIAFLLVALAHWKWAASAITGSATSVVQAKGLVMQVYVPKLIFPAFAIAISTTKFFIVMILMLLILLVLGQLYFNTLWWLPLLYILQILLLMGVGSVVALIMPFIPDLKPIIDSGIIVLMLVSGIFFDIETLPEEAQSLLYINPFAILITQYRHVLLSGMDPNMERLLYVACLSAALLIIGLLLGRRFDKEIPKVLI